MTTITGPTSESRCRHRIRRYGLWTLPLLLVAGMGAVQAANPESGNGDCTALRARVEQLQVERDRLRRQLSLLSKQLDKAHDKLSALRKIEQSINQDNSSDVPP